MTPLVECYRTMVRDRYVCLDRWPLSWRNWCPGCGRMARVADRLNAANEHPYDARMGVDQRSARAPVGAGPGRDSTCKGGAVNPDGTRTPAGVKQ